MNNFHDRRTLSDIFMEWYVRTQGQGAGASKPRQPKRWSRKLFEEFDSVSIERLIEDPYFFGARGRQLFEEHRRDILDLCERKLNGKEDIRTFAVEEGIRSGKTWKFSMVNAIFLFKNIIIDDYSRAYWGLAKGTKIGFWLTSRTKEHGTDVIFKEAMMVILESDFFTDYFPPQVTREQIMGMQRNPSVLRFWGDKVGLGVGSGRLGELNAQGYAIIFAGFDEVNHYQVTKASRRKGAEFTSGEFHSAMDGYQTLYQRVDEQFNFRGRWPIWSLIMAFGSARYDGDMTDTLIAEARKKGNKQILWRKRASWEARKRNLSGKYFTFDMKNMKIINEDKVSKRYEELVSGERGIEVEVDD